MKHKLTLSFITSILLLTGCQSTANTNYQQVSMQEATKLMETNDQYIILDVRTPSEYTDGHIPNAINIPNEIITDQELTQLPDKNQMIFIYCRSGNRSKQASRKLADLGYTNIIEFGGIIDWEGELE